MSGLTHVATTDRLLETLAVSGNSALERLELIIRRLKGEINQVLVRLAGLVDALQESLLARFVGGETTSLLAEKSRGVDDRFLFFGIIGDLLGPCLGESRLASNVLPDLIEGMVNTRNVASSRGLLGGEQVGFNL